MFCTVCCSPHRLASVARFLYTHIFFIFFPLFWRMSEFQNEDDEPCAPKKKSWYNPAHNEAAFEGSGCGRRGEATPRKRGSFLIICNFLCKPCFFFPSPALSIPSTCLPTDMNVGRWR